jgi:hypothetical protein
MTKLAKFEQVGGPAIYVNPIVVGVVEDWGSRSLIRLIGGSCLTVNLTAAKVISRLVNIQSK